MTTLQHTAARLLTPAWRLECITHWAKATEFWARYQDAPEGRHGLNQAYHYLGMHMHYLMRADSRADY